MNDNDLNTIKSDFPVISAEMYKLLTELYPICRSITGNGVRKTLEIIRNYIPIERHEVPSGTKVFDWIIPKEWNIGTLDDGDPLVVDQVSDAVPEGVGGQGIGTVEPAVAVVLQRHGDLTVRS